MVDEENIEQKKGHMTKNLKKIQSTKKILRK